MDQLLTLAIQAAFFVLFALALVRYLRDRNPLTREVLVVFASIAGLFATQLITLVWPERPQIVASSAAVLLLAEPLLVLRLIRHFEPVDRRIAIGVLGAFVLSAIGLLAGLSTTYRPVLLAIVAYFVITSLIDSIYLLRAARKRIGASRNRLQLAALASGLLGIAILVAAGASGNAADPVITSVSRLLALVAALAFLAAFAPPPFIRRFQQRAVAFDVARGVVIAPTGTPVDVSWHRLADAARQITGASAVLIAIGRPRSVVRVAEGAWNEPPEPGTPLPTPDLPIAAVARIVDPATVGLQDLARDAGATRVLEVPIGADRQPIGRLLAFLAGSPLFVEDDLALLTMLAALTARAIEREEAVAERTTLVNELRRTNDELARASAAKSDFLAAMSHELRTPLNSIIGFSELMLAPVNRAEGLRPLDVVDWATHIHGAGLQLLDLINEVLDLAKIEAGRLELRHERFDVPSLLGRTVDAMRPLADRRQIAITLAPAEPMTIEADPARVRQIVYNLLSNAIKFSPDDGSINVTTTRVGGEVRIAVEDRGPGIAREDQRRLFEAFQQTARGRAQAEGTGLGLALARRLAERHGGRIELVSELGAGSLFTLVLPVERPPGLAAQLAESKGPLVLVIEDDTSSAELLRANLEQDGYRVAVAPTGEHGIDQMRHLQPAAVILDILLPGIDGWEVMQRARAEPATRDIPILVVSLIDDAELGLALGAVDYFAKPVDRSALLLRLRRLLETDELPLGRPTILAIDDEPVAVEMYRAMLEPNGFDVVIATSGQAGVAAAKRLRPDAVVLDLTMPDMDGFEVAAALHADRATERLPILVATSRDLTDADKSRLNGHVAGILRKGDDALEGLRRWLKSHVTEAPSPLSGTSGGPETNGYVAWDADPRSGGDRPGTSRSSDLETAERAARSRAGR